MFRINEVSKDLRELDAMLSKIKAKELEASQQKKLEAACEKQGHELKGDGYREGMWCDRCGQSWDGAHYYE